jgi:hypothetical protein
VLFAGRKPVGHLLFSSTQHRKNFENALSEVQREFIASPGQLRDWPIHLGGRRFRHALKKAL